MSDDESTAMQAAAENDALQMQRYYEEQDDADE